MRQMAKETHIKTDKKNRWRLGCLGVTNNKNNDAFIDRVRAVKVPYCLRVTKEAQIYSKLLENSELFEAPCTPETLKILS